MLRVQKLLKSKFRQIEKSHDEIILLNGIDRQTKTLDNIFWNKQNQTYNFEKHQGYCFKDYQKLASERNWTFNTKLTLSEYKKIETTLEKFIPKPAFAEFVMGYKKIARTETYLYQLSEIKKKKICQ